MSEKQAPQIVMQLTVTAMQTGHLSGTVEDVSAYFIGLYERLEEVVDGARKVEFSWANSGSAASVE